MKKAKRISAICIALAMCALTACADNVATESNSTVQSTQTTTSQTSYKSVKGFKPDSGKGSNHDYGSTKKSKKSSTTSTKTSKKNYGNYTRSYNSPTAKPNPTQKSQANPQPRPTNPTKSPVPSTNHVAPINSPFLNEAQSVLNSKRSKAGVGSVTADANLTKLAEVRVKEISKSFSHTRPDGRESKSIFGDYGVPMPDWRAENIATAIKFDDVADIFSEWMKSDGHRKNLLNPKAKRFGMARYTAPNGKMYSVIILAS